MAARLEAVGLSIPQRAAGRYSTVTVLARLRG